jgi:4a-hydroxytetrahydrobiopterin dehydratase
MKSLRKIQTLSGPSLLLKSPEDPIMAVQTSAELAGRKCLPCEGDVAALKPTEAQALLKKLEGWKLAARGKRIRKEWLVKNFVAGIDFFERVARVAEAEGHHPDLHLEGYRHVAIEIWTHAIGGLSENDFILAAKIDRLPVKLKSTT